MSFPSVFLVLDLQNDLCHPEGAYSKHGLVPSHISNILPNIIDNMEFCHKMKIPIIATQMTVLVDANRNPIGLGSLKKMRPFLEKEGLRVETWGHDLLERLPKVDYKIKKWNLSPFYQTELEKYLAALGTKELILSGFTTNGVVETLAREAVGRNFKIITLTDCVASYSDSLHQASLSNLSAFGQIMNSKEWRNNFTQNATGNLYTQTI